MDPFPSRGAVLLTHMTASSDVEVVDHIEGEGGVSRKWWDDGAESVATHTDVRRLTDIGLTSDGTGSSVSHEIISSAWHCYILFYRVT